MKNKSLTKIIVPSLALILMGCAGNQMPIQESNIPQEPCKTRIEYNQNGSGTIYRRIILPNGECAELRSEGFSPTDEVYMDEGFAHIEGRY